MKSFGKFFALAIALLLVVCGCSSSISRRGLDGEVREVSSFHSTPISAHSVRADEYSEQQIRMGKLPGGEERVIALQNVRDNNQSPIDNTWQRTYNICMRSHYDEQGADKFCAQQAAFSSQVYMYPGGGYYAPSYGQSYLLTPQTPMYPLR
ncbi:hypothetical protein KKG46_04740 [Patescibacteria group bacterium]|nr:hypothetical protein [Patescibacteria group bacterium]